MMLPLAKKKKIVTLCDFCVILLGWSFCPIAGLFHRMIALITSVNVAVSSGPHPESRSYSIRSSLKALWRSLSKNKIYVVPAAEWKCFRKQVGQGGTVFAYICLQCEVHNYLQYHIYCTDVKTKLSDFSSYPENFVSLGIFFTKINILIYGDCQNIVDLYESSNKNCFEKKDPSKIHI